METQEKLHREQIPDRRSQEIPNGKEDDLYTKGSSSAEEIDLVDLGKKIWAQRRILWISTICFFVIGIFIAAFSPEEYASEIVLLPQSGSSASLNITSGLLKQFGIGGGNNNPNESLSMALYPDITHSTPFMLHLLEEDVYFSNLDTTTTFLAFFSEINNKKGFGYYLKQYTIGLPATLIKLPLNIINGFNSNSKTTRNENTTENTTVNSLQGDTSNVIDAAYIPTELTPQQVSVMNELRSRITTTVKENGTIVVSSKMPDPYVAAKTTELAVRFLTNYIKEYRTDKVQADLKFVQQQYEEKEARYNKSQQKLAILRDRNANIVSENARIELERAQTEFSLASSLFLSVSQQLEQSQIKVQEETPLFKVLEPIQVPLSKSGPSQELVVIAFTFGGLFLGFGVIFMKIFYQHLKSVISV